MNNYHIYEEEAKGKYSVIFKARKKKKLDFVAIKRLQKTRKAKVYNQAKILSELHHPNIIKFYDFMQTKNHMWEITEYCPGGDLLKIIEYDKQLPEHTVRGFMLEVMAGLQFAHSKGVIVCDIKPACVLVNQYGSVKLGDFGSAQRLVDLMGKAKAKKKGTPSYMAPELFQSNGVYSFQSDLWALGCMMYELGQGNPPFVSTNFQEISLLAKTAPTPKIQNFSSDFNHLLCRLLAKDPANRIEWQQIIVHPWIRRQLPELDIPVQTHFLQYIQQRKKQRTQQLRVSHNFQSQNYGSANATNMVASNRRQVFQFQNYNEDQGDYENQNFEDEKGEAQFQLGVMNVEINMKKNKQASKNVNLNIQKSKGINDKQKQAHKKQPSKAIQDSSDINLFLETMTSKPTISLQQAISHQSDNAVKPIIGNKDIQVIQSTNFNKNQLGFSYIEPEILAEGIVNHDMDNELKRILDGMKGDDKINVLGYFETIVQNSQVANELFKSNYIPYYMSLLKSYKQSSLRAKMCEVLGLLIRHATSIDSDILKYGIISGFVEAVTKDKSEKVRRKAMAALGQLLFYGATQVDQDAMEWDIPLSLISTLLKILKNPAQDQIVKVYCCKSIQNITAQAQKVGLNFAQIDTLIVMIGCFNSTKNQGFKTSIMSTIHHMISLNQTLREIFLEKMPLNFLIQVFNDPESSSKTVQILLWAFLMQFTKNSKSKHSRVLLQSKQLIKSVLSMIESGSSVVKGRVYLFVYFLLRHDFKKICMVCESKLFHCIERYNKQTGKYQSQGLQYVVSLLFEQFPLLLKLCTQELQSAITSPSSQIDRNNFIIAISQMQSCQVFDQLFCSQQNVQLLLNIMNLIDTKQSSEKPYFQHFKNHYFLVLEKIFIDEPTTQKLQEFYCSFVLPFLIGKMLKTQFNDIRYCCIKYIICLINFCLSEEFLYDSTILTSTSSKISSLVVSHLIPQLDVLLDQSQVVANMMFKLMAQLFKGRPIFVAKFLQACDLRKLLKYYGQNAAVNVLKTVELLFGQNHKNRSEQQYNKVVGQFWFRTVELLKIYCQSGQELFLEYPLSILTNILTNYSQTQLQNQQIDCIFECSVQLQSHQDPLVRTKAQKLIQVLLQNRLFSEKGLQDWRMLSKKGLENYELFTKLSGLKPNIKPTQAKQLRNQKQSRYNS